MIYRKFCKNHLYLKRNAEVTMQSTFTLKIDELNIDFIKGLKKIFKGNVLAITVSDNSDTSDDETEYLLGNPANKKFLLEGIAKIEKGNVKKIEASSL